MGPESNYMKSYHKYVRDIETARGRINCIAREISCDCMEEKRIEAKLMEKVAGLDTNQDVEKLVPHRHRYFYQEKNHLTLTRRRSKRRWMTLTLTLTTTTIKQQQCRGRQQ
mmetsp:Transcript_44456/g.48116  ORF Transcript_44456/g.48116 Transcript_44456/m.48116 type:complete len:111 (+) Transcript_44456:2-334(+)